METTNTTKFFRHSSIEGKPSKVGRVDCHRCGGSGIFHIFGTCFRCGGQGADPTERQWVFPSDWTDEQIIEWTEAREAKNAKARESAAKRRQAKAEATWDRNVAKCPGLQVVQDDYRTNEDASWFGLLNDMRFTASQFDLSDKQVEAFNRSFEKELEIRADREKRAAERAEAKASTPGWESGRQVVTGTVKTRRLQESDYGSTWKIRLVTDEGQGLWVTEPSAITTDLEDRVTMTVTVEVSDDDPTFAFGKRPTKAEVL